MPLSPPSAPSPPLPLLSSPPSSESPPTPSSLEAKKIATLQAKISALESQIADLKIKEAEIQGKLRNPDAGSTVRQHIALLHTYNEIRDVGTGLMGIIAENRGVRVRDVHRDFGVEISD